MNKKKDDVFMSIKRKSNGTNEQDDGSNFPKFENTSSIHNNKEWKKRMSNKLNYVPHSC